jgi:hypothetical protein
VGGAFSKWVEHSASGWSISCNMQQVGGAFSKWVEH